MQKDKLIQLYTQRGYNKDTTRAAVSILERLECHALNNGDRVDSISTSTVQSFINSLIETDENTQDNLLAMARYFKVINNQPIYLYFTGLFGSIDVIPTICNRIKDKGYSHKSKLINRETLPLGTELKSMPQFTNDFMNDLKDVLPEDQMIDALTGNNHRLAPESMAKEKAFYQQASSFDDYLHDRHQRKVEELTSFMNENEVWFEQVITQEVIDYVASNQEILSGVREGRYLYITKIPYDTKSFLSATSKEAKLYHACHCPFVRENLINPQFDIDPNWCYCSAGFAKFPFEVILDQPLQVELIDSPLKGDLQCRFKVTLPEGVM